MAQTTTHLAGHNFDSYAELRHNGEVIAKAFGEAKNYELLTEHFKTFRDWLEDCGFQPNRDIPDLAFLFAPTCPELLRLKIANSEIEWQMLPREVDSQHSSLSSQDTAPEVIQEPNAPSPQSGVDINTASVEELVSAFQGSSMRRSTIEKLVENRDNQQYVSLDRLIQDLGSTENVKAKLQQKLEEGIIYFSLAST